MTTKQVNGLTLRGTLELTESGHVPIELFGKDHWSLLGYIGARIENNPTGADGIGEMDRRNLRCNEERHPMHNHHDGWEPKYGTRLKGYFNNGKTNEDWQIPEHDDWDCLDDLEAAGLITVYSEINGFVGINPGRGMDIYLQLHKHKVEGGHFATFEPKGV